MPEWSLGAANWTLQANAHQRKKCPEKACCRGSGQIAPEIRDPQIPENSDCFTVVFANGTSQSVEHSRKPADAVLDISTFSALISGVCDWDDAKLTFRGLEVHRDAPFSQVFYLKPLMICDYF